MAAMPDKQCRLIPFNFSASTKFQLELGPQTMRFWRGDGSALSGAPVATPWLELDLDGIQHGQVNDLMFLTHEGHWPQRLIRYSDTDWRLTDLFADLSTAAAPTIPGEAGRAYMEWWMPWTGTFPSTSAAVMAVRTQEAFFKTPTSAADVTSLALPAVPGATGSWMRRVTGVLTVPTTGTWRIYFQANEGATLYLDEVYVGGVATFATESAFIDKALTGGQAYMLELYSWNVVQSGYATISLSGPGFAKAPVPASMLKKRDVVAPLPELASVIKWPPMLDENVSPTTVALSHTTGIGRTLTASADTFTAGHVGSFWEVGHFRDTLSAELLFDPAAGPAQNKTSSELRVKGRWDFLTTGIWQGAVYIEEKTAAGTWEPIHKWTGVNDRNLTASAIVEQETILRLRATGISASAAAGVAKPRFVLESVESLVLGLVKITAVTTPKTATVDIISAAHSTELTNNWSEGAWSNERGFPRAVCLHSDGRLWFAGTRTEPQKLWGSVVDDFLNFRRGVQADSPITIQIRAQEANPILWLASQRGMIIGTQAEEWLLDSGDEGLKPDNAVVERRSRYGSEPFQALMAGSVVLFIQRGGQVLAEYVYQFEEQNYVAPDVSKLVGHLTRSGLRRVAYAQNPDQILWAVNNDGQLLSCTYQRTEQVVAWAVHPTAGFVESVSVVYGDNRAADEVWIVVRRTVGGVETRRIERFDSAHWDRLHAGTDPVFHIDAAVVAKGVDPMTSLGGLDHLNGEMVEVVTDGGEHTREVVAAGQIMLEAPSTFAAAGLACEAEVQPMPLDFPLQDGTAQGRKMTVPIFAIRLYKSSGCQYADGPEEPFYVLPFRSAPQDQDFPPPPFSGFVRQQAAGRLRDELTIIVKSRGPLALNILGLIPNVNIYGS